MRYLTYEGVRQLLEQLRGKAKVDVLLEGDSAPSQEPASAPRTSAAPVTPAPIPAVPAVLAPAAAKKS